MDVHAIIHASELITGVGIRKKDGRRVCDEDLHVIEDGAILYTVKSKNNTDVPNKIAWVGPTKDTPKGFNVIKTTDLKNKQVVIPGLIDCHTHLVFAGDRSSEFAQRCAGASYEQIAKKGGGILTTVEATRKASFDELYDLAKQRLRECLSYGVKTIEIKSGYGLSFDAEVKSLKVIRKLQEDFPEINIQSTYLGAHAIPKDQDRDKYINEIVNKTLPFVVEENLTDCCDVFVDRGYYSVEEAKKILEKSLALGIKIKLHGDEIACTESASLGVELGALSVDHLLKVSQKGILDLSHSDTVAVLLPATAFYLKEEYAPAREMIDSGVAVALSTDCNPGSSMTSSLPAVMTIAALYMQMSRAEIFAAVTYNAAKALGMESQQGTLEENFDAKITILPFKKFEEIYYRFAWSPNTSR